MSKKLFGMTAMDDGRIVPEFYKADLIKAQRVLKILRALPAEFGQAHVAARALQNVLDGVYETDVDAPEE